jgi:hypothetical protein
MALKMLAAYAAGSISYANRMARGLLALAGIASMKHAG